MSPAAVLTEPVAAAEPLLISAREVARMLGCSERHVLRLDDEGRMVRGMRLGTLRRWDRATVVSWIKAGCPEPK